MLTRGDQETLSHELMRAACEAVSLDDLGRDVLPRLDRLLETSTSVLYLFDERGTLVPVAGRFVTGSARYAEHYMAMDPMQPVIARLNPSILHGPRHPEWKQFLRLPVYTDHARPHGLDTYFILRLSNVAYGDPGMVGVLLGRSRRQPEYEEHDGLLLARILPALEAAARRIARVEERLGDRAILESMIDADAKPRVALDTRGGLLWASDGARAALGLSRRRTLPDELVAAARRMGALVWREPVPRAPASTVRIAREKAAPVHAELRLARTRTGEPFVIAELETAGLPPPLAARFGLTPAEAEVLALMALGLSDRDIRTRLCVSLPTVRTHVGRTLAKLGVRSRTQAALLAHGLLTQR